MQARVINNGQSCIAAKRFIVHESIAPEFEAKFVEAMRQLVVGDPMAEATQIGPLATRAIRDELDDQVRRSVAAGARVLTGGHTLRWTRQLLRAHRPRGCSRRLARVL